MDKYNLGNKTATELKDLLIEAYQNIDTLNSKLSKTIPSQLGTIFLGIIVTGLFLSPIIWGLVTLEYFWFI